MYLHWLYTSKSQLEVNMSLVQKAGKDSSNKKHTWSPDILELTDKGTNIHQHWFATPALPKTKSGEKSPAMGIIGKNPRQWTLSTCLSQLTAAHFREELSHPLPLSSPLSPFFPARNNKKLGLERRGKEERKEGPWFSLPHRGPSWGKGEDGWQISYEMWVIVENRRF